MELIVGAPVTGRVTGYKSSWNIFSHNAYVVVSVYDTKILVYIDNRQMKYVQKEYPPGSLVNLQSNGRRWQIISKPSDDEVYTPEAGESYNDMIERISCAKSS